MTKLKISDRVRDYNWTTFKALPIGAKFHHSLDVDCAGLVCIGLCEKVSARQYRILSENPQACGQLLAACGQLLAAYGLEQLPTVGSINVVVLRDKDGRPERLRHSVPYLGD